MNILVVKSSRSQSHLGMSRPCVNCVKRLLKLPTYSGYKIKDVFYTEGETVTKIRMNHLANQPSQHIPRFQGVNGVARVNGKWRARPSYQGKSYNLGYFDSALEAADTVREFLSQNSSQQPHICSHNHTHGHSCGEDEVDSEEDDDDE